MVWEPREVGVDRQGSGVTARDEERERLSTLKSLNGFMAPRKVGKDHGRIESRSPGTSQKGLPLLAPCY